MSNTTALFSQLSTLKPHFSAYTGTYCGNSKFRICPAETWNFNPKVLRPVTRDLDVSFFRKSSFFGANLYRSLGSLDSSKHYGVEYMPHFKSRTLSKKPYVSVATCDYPQNADLPRRYSKKERKPFPVPIVELRRAARERVKLKKKGQLRVPTPPPKMGLVVKGLVPLAYDVYNARIALINNLRRLMKVVPVHACGWCSEIHVGPVGHLFKSCKGKNAAIRKSLHEWTEASVEDIFLPIEAYHLFDRLGKRITHHERFSVPRVPALVELCIQAGVDIPEYPTKRRRKPIIRISKSEFVDADESDLPDPIPEALTPLLVEIPASDIVAPDGDEERILLAEETLHIWDKLRKGAKQLMKMYPVRVCGYCPEVHVGPTGHKAQICGAFKHQQRNGQHAWQSATLDDLIPPRYVWHVRNVNGPPLQWELRAFYGQAPAVVELCVQAGAEVPDEYKPTMRLDVGIPSDTWEAEMVV